MQVRSDISLPEKTIEKAPVRKKSHAGTVGDYLEGVHADARSALERLRRIVRTTAPGMTEVSYRILVVKHRGHPGRARGDRKRVLVYTSLSSSIIPRLASWQENTLTMIRGNKILHIGTASYWNGDWTRIGLPHFFGAGLRWIGIV